jgi:hypothetical protein
MMKSITSRQDCDHYVLVSNECRLAARYHGRRPPNGEDYNAHRRPLFGCRLHIRTISYDRRQATAKEIYHLSGYCLEGLTKKCCGGEDSLEAQVQFAKSTNNTFVASEKEMYDAMTTVYYDYVVVLRDSKSRYKSHWMHLLSDANTYPVSVRKGDMDTVHNRFMIPMHGVRYSVGNMTKWWQNQPDNYNVRMICGSKCLNVPKYQITPELFEYTLKRIDKFSHSMFLEDMEGSFKEFARHISSKQLNPQRFQPLPPTGSPTVLPQYLQLAHQLLPEVDFPPLSYRFTQ